MPWRKEEVRPNKRLYVCNHFVAIVVLSSFHDDVTEVSFVWLHNEAYMNI